MRPFKGRSAGAVGLCLGGEEIEEIHVRAGRTDGRVVPAGHEKEVAVPDDVELVKRPVGSIVAVERGSLRTIESEVVRFLEIRRPVNAIVAVWWPTAPPAAGRYNL